MTRNLVRSHFNVLRFSNIQVPCNIQGQKPFSKIRKLSCQVIVSDAVHLNHILWQVSYSSQCRIYSISITNLGPRRSGWI